MMSSDRALVDPAEDRLGFAGFSKRIAQNVLAMSSPDAITIAINGPWGSGKTSVLNFVDYFIGQSPDGSGFIRIHFNPWWFSGREDLVRQFFSQLEACLGKKDLISKETRTKLADLADHISELPIPYVSGSKALSGVLRPKPTDILKLKDEVSIALRNAAQRIVVFLDDIDRLSSTEISQLFALIKGVADFPNIVYLLAFDRGVVSKALGQEYSDLGDDYLDKIVQVPLQLPLVNKISLRRILFSRIDAITEATPPELFDKQRWQNLFFKGIDHFLETPRDIIRLANGLRFTYPAVRGEVSFPDFVSVESLRIFHPEIHSRIKNESQWFVGSWDSRLQSLDNFKAYHLEWMDKLPRRLIRPMKEFIVELFPKLSVVWGSGSYGSSWLSKWRKQLLVCSPEIFPVYFRLSVDEGAIGNLEMRTILGKSGDKALFSQELMSLVGQHRPDGRTRFRSFIELFEDYRDENFVVSARPSIVSAFFSVADRLEPEEDYQHGFAGFDNTVYIARNVRGFLKQIPEADRFEILKQSIKDGEAVSFSVSEVIDYGAQHGKYEKQPIDESERMLTLEHVNELEEMCMEKILGLAKTGQLLVLPKLPMILGFWIRSAHRDELDKWVGSILVDEQSVAKLLEAFLRKELSFSDGDVAGKEFYRLDPEWMRPALDPDVLMERIKSLRENKTLTPRQSDAVKQFIREHEMRQAGKDPNSVDGLRELSK